MITIADKLADVRLRIVETERLIAELKLASTAEGLVLIETASTVFRQLRDYQQRLRASLRLMQGQ